MKLLVTGGGGYIGSIVSAQFILAGHNVVICDNLIRGHRDSVPEAAEFVLADISDRRSLDALFARHSFDAVVHFAAFAHVPESMRLPELYFSVNTAATLVLLNAVLDAGINKFVFASTCAVYGESDRGAIRESDPVLPINPYGESKLLVERALRWLNHTRGLRYASLRFFNVAGATNSLGDRRDMGYRLIPLILQTALGQNPQICIFGTDYSTPDGTCVRDYIHVLDVADVHMLVLEALLEHDTLIYNVGSGKGVSVRTVIEVASRVTKRSIPFVEAPRRRGEPAVLIASSERIQAELNWKPRYSALEEIIASAWEYCLQRR